MNEAEIKDYLEKYAGKLTRALRETQTALSNIDKEIKEYGFETVYLKQRARGQVQGLVILTNDTTSYLRRRVKILHISTLEREEQEEAFKRVAEMALTYIWKYTLADEAKF